MLADMKRDDWLAALGLAAAEVPAALILRGTRQLKEHAARHRGLLEAEPRVCSVFRLISDEAHARGLARLREHVREHPDDPWLVEESMTLFTVRKPR